MNAIEDSATDNNAPMGDEPAGADERRPLPEEADDESEIPPEDQPPSAAQPETQGDDPIIAELGEEGEGDLAPGDA